jgi:predicted TIM-barrel fold metal-dependent hydrolase
MGEAEFVDTNVHLIAEDVLTYPTAPLYTASGPSSYRLDHLTSEEFLQHMAAAGAEQAVLVNAVFEHGYDNSYAADCVARYPDKFAGVANVDGFAPDAVDTVRYWIRERGMGGLRFYRADLIDEPLWLDDPEFAAVLDEVARLGVVVDLSLLNQTTTPPKVRTVLEQYPETPFLLSYLGHPVLKDGPPYASAAGILSLASFPNAYAKIAATNIYAASEGYSTPEAFVRVLIEAFGADRIICASYFPGRENAYADPVATRSAPRSLFYRLVNSV